MNRKCYSYGFTLIELLIVVAIIAILAAIAVPNFLEAQVRAKTARVKADLRTASGALEMYRIDNSQYPTMFQPGFIGGVPPLAGSDLKWWYLPDSLSTPVAYIASSAMFCPFGGNFDKQPFFPGMIWRRYGYENINDMVARAKDPKFKPILGARYPDAALEWSGQWRIQSIGPDRLWNPSVTYDPSNGSVSGGDIIRTQKATDGNIRAHHTAPGNPVP